jgi:hypothetical protein
MHQWMEPHFHSQIHSVVNEPKVYPPLKTHQLVLVLEFFQNFHTSQVLLLDLFLKFCTNLGNWYWIVLVNFHTNLVVALGCKADFWLVSEGYIPDIELGTALK